MSSIAISTSGRCSVPCRRWQAASSSVYGASVGTFSAASSSTVRSAGRNPASAWNSVSAQISSGLWLASR